MKPTLPKPSGGDFTLTPAGLFPAVCYRIIDLGTQRNDYQGQEKHDHQISIGFELCDDECTMQHPETGEIVPLSIHQTFTWSMNEKANLRKFLEAWRGVAFTEADFGEDGFDIRNLLGAPALLNIVHYKNKKGDDRAKIGSISRLAKGMQKPVGVNQPVFIWLHPDLWNQAHFDALSEGMRTKISASPEYIELKHGKPKVDPQAPIGEEGSRGYGDPLDDEIPF